MFYEKIQIVMQAQPNLQISIIFIPYVTLCYTRATILKTSKNYSASPVIFSTTVFGLISAKHALTHLPQPTQTD